MNTKALLSASLAANALLLGVEVYLVRQDPGDLSTLAPIVVCTHTRLDATQKPVVGAVPAADPGQSFDQRRAGSEDYTQTIAIVRATGQVHPTNRWQP